MPDNNAARRGEAQRTREQADALVARVSEIPVPDFDRDANVDRRWQVRHGRTGATWIVSRMKDSDALRCTCGAPMCLHRSEIEALLPPRGPGGRGQQAVA